MAYVKVWTDPGMKEWLVDIGTRRISPAENGVTGVDHPLCLEDFRESGREAVRAFDRENHEWVLNLETFVAVPAIAGGDDIDGFTRQLRDHDVIRDVPVSSESGAKDYCRHHPIPQRLQRFYDEELDDNFGCGQIVYCPVLECDFVKPEALGLEPGPLNVKKNELLLMTAARQKAFFRKFRERFFGSGK